MALPQAPGVGVGGGLEEGSGGFRGDPEFREVLVDGFVGWIMAGRVYVACVS